MCYFTHSPSTTFHKDLHLHKNTSQLGAAPATECPFSKGFPRVQTTKLIILLVVPDCIKAERCFYIFFLKMRFLLRVTDPRALESNLNPASCSERGRHHPQQQLYFLASMLLLNFHNELLIPLQILPKLTVQQFFLWATYQGNHGGKLEI